MRHIWALGLLLSAAAQPATLVVAKTGPFSTIQSAVNAARRGETVLIHAGIYRESIVVSGDGLTVRGATGEDVVITGADPIPAAAWVQEPEKPIWRHAPWTYHGATHPNDDFHRVIGRTEQVIVDGKLLTPVVERNEMRPGTFCADTAAKVLLVWLEDGGAPANHAVEASVRPLLFKLSGRHNIISHLHFRYASNRAQESALVLDGADNVAEDCVAEWTNGSGVRIDGERNVARRVVSRHNGQIGMSGHGVKNRMEECTLAGNNVKGFKKGWEAGGIKVAASRNFQIVRSIATGNDGPGFWFDIDNRDEKVESSYAAENNGPGIFVEISETAVVRNNLCVRNGLKEESGAWGHAGILLGEAMRCVVEHNVCLGNRTGIEVRQQRVRDLPADPKRDRPEEKRYYSDQLVFRHNISAYNRDWQFALFGDNGFFGGHESPAEDLPLLGPGRRQWRSTDNLYYAAPAEGMILWGAKWRPKHQEYRDLERFEREHHLEEGSLAADPLFVDWETGDYTLRPASPAKRMDAGFTEPPVTPRR